MKTDIKEILKRLDQVEESNKTAYQKLAEGLMEHDRQKEMRDTKELEKYLGKSLDKVNPLEVGEARQRMVEEKQEEARQELAENMAELLHKKKNPVNWLNQEIK